MIGLRIRLNENVGLEHKKIIILYFAKLKLTLYGAYELLCEENILLASFVLRYLVQMYAKHGG